MSTSLRLPADIKRRIARLARAHATTPHSFMLEAIRDRVADEEAHAAFLAEGEKRLSEMQRTRLAVTADEAFAHLDRRLAGKKTRRPRARRH